MQASMDAFGLKPFTRALTCLSKYGDNLTICATANHISLAATNSSLTAYCRFKYGRQFFSRYHVGDRHLNRMAMADEADEILTVTGQLLTKSLLSILKHRTVEKTVDRCELSIVEGVLPSQGADQDEGDEGRDSFESKLIVRLHCKHGVVKTHRLLLHTPTSLSVPGIPDGSNDSRLTIGPKPVRDMLEHFPFAKGGKSDPQLVWSFGDTEVQLKSCEISIDSKGKSQLSTELTISAEEFDVYDIYLSPITIAFHLREFNATIAFAESMSFPLDLHFTDPASPLFIEIESDNSETLFVISTSQACANASVHSQAQSDTAHNLGSVNRKRMREDDNANGNEDDDDHNSKEGASTHGPIPRSRPKEKIKKPIKAVQRADPASVALALANSSRPGTVRGSMPPPNSIPFRPLSQTPVFSQIDNNNNNNGRDPLFLPGSQLSVAEEEAIRDSGLGIESMGADELEALLEGDGEEVAFDFGSQRGMSQMNSDVNLNMDRDDAMEREEGRGAGDSFDVIEDMEIEATQAEGAKPFKPLFED